jgi:hypothetical protein
MYRKRNPGLFMALKRKVNDRSEIETRRYRKDSCIVSIRLLQSLDLVHTTGTAKEEQPHFICLAALEPVYLTVAAVVSAPRGFAVRY